MQNIISTFCILTAMTFALLPATSIAEQGKKASKLAQVIPPVYKPPLRGAPESRIGGGTRGPGDNRPQLTVLSPSHTGLTIMASPTLYWHASHHSQLPLEITIINEATLNTVLEVRKPNSGNAGIHHINLADHGIELKHGVEYRWFVTLVSDENQRSNDIITSATIKRIVAPDSLASTLAKYKEIKHPVIHAEKGIWYDAIDGLSKIINKQPTYHAAIQQRSALLEQVGIHIK